MLRKNLSKHNNVTINALLKSVFCLLVCLFLCGCANAGNRVNDVPIFVACDDFRYSNIRQDRASVQMQSIDGSLYIYIRGDHKEDPAVYRFDSNGVSTMEDIFVLYQHKTLWNDGVLGFANGCIYIKRHPGRDTETGYPKKAELLCYDLTDGTVDHLAQTDAANDLNCVFDHNGYIYVTTAEMSMGDQKQYSRIEDNAVLPDAITEPDARTGKVLEVMYAYNKAEPMLSETQLNNAAEAVTELEIHNRDCVLYPFDGGWLLHMSSSKIPLCLVLPDGTVSSVFTYDCMSSSSSFNIYGDTAYISLVRYEKWDDSMGYFLERYENDTISGTYQIDLTDMTTTKISDQYYCGLFLFDDTGIFACDLQDGVYKLDPDGNTVAALIEPRDYP